MLLGIALLPTLPTDPVSLDLAELTPPSTVTGSKKKYPPPPPLQFRIFRKQPTLKPHSLIS